MRCAQANGNWRCARLAAPGRKRCAECLEVKRQAYRAIVQRRKEAGLCTRCAYPPVEGKTLCAPCLMRQSVKDQERRGRLDGLVREEEIRTERALGDLGELGEELGEEEVEE